MEYQKQRQIAHQPPLQDVHPEPSPTPQDTVHNVGAMNNASNAVNASLKTTAVVTLLNVTLNNNGITFKTAAAVVTSIGSASDIAVLTTVAQGVTLPWCRTPTLLSNITIPPTTTFNNFSYLVTGKKLKLNLASSTFTVILTRERGRTYRTTIGRPKPSNNVIRTITSTRKVKGKNPVTVRTVLFRLPHRVL